MAGRAMDDDGSIADLPWASIFDPAANVRALSAIQARGFRAATEVVDRFVRVTERRFGAPLGSVDDEPDGSQTAAPEIGRLVKTLRTTLSQLGESAGGSPKSAEPALDLDNSTASGEAHLVVTEPGPAVAEIWLHNTGPVDLGKVRLRCGELLSHDGAVIPAARIRFEPDVVPMPDRCSRGITVEVDVAQNDLPGRYRGTVLVDGHCDVWLPIVLTIKPQAT